MKNETIGRALAVWALTSPLACASTHSGAFAIPVDASGRVLPSSTHLSGLVISSRQLTELSSRDFGVVEVTFENPSSHWVRIKTTALDFGSEARNAAVFIPAGDDLERWHEGTKRRNDIRDTNTGIALELLFAGAALMAVAGGHSSVGAGGALVAAGTAGVIAGRDIKDRVENAQTASIYPATHLMTVPFAVPPGLAVKRWVVLNAHATQATGCINYASLAYDTEDQKQERVRLSFADFSSEWQESACALRVR
jgi:hypothetical protein